MYQIIEVIGMPKRLYQKICLIMRLTTVIMIACLMQVSAAGLAQKITLNERNTPLNNVLRTIGKQSGFAVYFDGKNSLKSQKVTVVVTNASIEEALHQAFKGLGYTYKIDGKTIAIKPKEQPGFLERIIDRLKAIDVTGKVVDEKGEPIAGATIRVKGTTISTVSDGNGYFLLKNISEDAVLEISYLGYQVKEVKALKDIGSIRMELAIGKLEEVIVNAGYYRVKERELTGNISRISSKDIESQPVLNVLATMQGRMAGVEIIQDNGTPGGAFKIKIRGQNSLRAAANEPLYIVDGVPFASETIGTQNTSGTFTTMTSPLNAINPSDIESIEILKDADATAIYGSRGANGVVLISTKKGKAGKTKISINSATSKGRVTTMLDLMDTKQYLAMREQAYANDGITNYPADAYDINGKWDRNRYTDWQKELIGGTAEITTIQASITGGNAQTQYLLSGNTAKETTVYPGDFKYKRGAVHFNLNHISEDRKFKLILSSQYSFQVNLQPVTDLTRLSRTLAPNAPALYDQNGNLNWENSTWQNPLAAQVAKFNAKINNLNANGVLSYSILPNLELTSNFGYTDVRNYETNAQPHTMYNPALGLNSSSSSLYSSLVFRSSWIIEPQIKWTLTAGKGKLEALVGGTFQSQTNNRLGQSGFGFSTNSLIYDLSSASLKVIDISDETKYNYEAIFARLNYNWDGKYIANITARRDGSSRFGPGKQFANFGAIGAAWIFSKENLFKDQSILSFGKLRTSYGITGSDQIGDYQFLDTYLSSGNTYQGTVGLQPTRLFNSNFAWETNRKFETALEMGFFDDGIFINAAYYLNRSSNQLVGIPLPGTTGFASLTANLGATVQNKGFEFSVETKNILSKQFSWTSDFNISTNRNKLISYPGLATSNNSNTYVVGESINILKRYQYTGINPQTGVYTFKDMNGDGQITSLMDRTLIFDLNPSFFGGLQNQFTYRNIQLNFLFQFVKQKATAYAPGLPGRLINQLSSLTNVWQKPNDEADYQKMTSNNSALNIGYSLFNLSDGTIVDASFIRLKNVALSYEIKPKLLKGIACRIYFQGQNLLTFTSFEGGDPEYKLSGYLPPLRVYTAGLQLTF
ncbi:TonB-linked SusC/RagA family outer membrane protein [Pedobacter africanus]|uniref:TonB-linked SusC/RagA family outer membrane protein n=1 Tax=Pedobacter africanus TaxID=151894 RepID=A0ACC6L0X0_9SPHI|nr:SusC/RagA family TonB-linked outer membrane protein [Pedobacter africanus]MDR6785278.1 TonB-linked SusC/RagA family outer membrane protein [Pedobacter africanus]